MAPRALARFVGEALVTLCVAWGWTHVFILPYCDLFFRCGCTWPWAGGIAHCNIYDAALPDCPWCTAPPWAAWIPFRGMIGAMTLGSLAARRALPRWWARPLGGIATFLVYGFVAAVAFKWAMAYPYFLWVGPA